MKVVHRPKRKKERRLKAVFTRMRRLFRKDPKPKAIEVAF